MEGTSPQMDEGTKAKGRKAGRPRKSYTPGKSQAAPAQSQATADQSQAAQGASQAAPGTKRVFTESGSVTSSSEHDGNSVIHDDIWSAATARAPSTLWARHAYPPAYTTYSRRAKDSRVG